MITEKKVELRIDEVDLRDRAYEVLVSYGESQDRAVEIAFAIARAARKCSTVMTTVTQTAENVATPSRIGGTRYCQVEHSSWDGDHVCGNPLPCPRHK